MIRRAPCIDWLLRSIPASARSRRRHSRSIRLHTFPRKAARRHRRSPDDRARLPARRARARRLARDRGDRRSAHRDDGHRVRRQRQADARRPSHRHRSPGRGRRDARLRRRRQRAGRRAADRSARHRRGRRAVRRSGHLDDHAVSAHREPARADQSERRQGRPRSGGFALYFSRAPIPYARDPRGGWPPLYRHIGLYAYRRSALLVLASLDADPARAGRGARTAAGARARHPDQGGGNGIRLDRRRHAGRSRTGAPPARGARVGIPAEDRARS